jgi:hypothetical protein
VERNRKAGQNPPRVVAPIEEEACASLIVPFECATAATAFQDHRSQITDLCKYIYIVTGSVLWLLCLVFCLAAKNFPGGGEGGEVEHSLHVQRRLSGTKHANGRLVAQRAYKSSCAQFLIISEIVTTYKQFIEIVTLATFQASAVVRV